MCRIRVVDPLASSPGPRVVYNTPAVSPPDESVEICRGCGGKNPSGSGECDWCGRPFVTKGGRLRLTIWQVLSSLLLLGLIGAVAALAVLNAGRALPPVRVSAPTNIPGPTIVPTPAVTPRVTVANAATATPPPIAADEGGPTAAPTTTPPTPVPTPEPQLQAARIVNTSGLGVSVRLQPGPQAARAGVLREGTRVLLTGNDQTVAARPWREIETEDHNLKGWVQGDFLQLAQATP
jgi:hypothetical protein